MYLVACALVFLGAYTLNLCYVSIFYHRALAHRSVCLRHRTRRFVIATGIWVTGIDPKAWVSMHRKHHACSDERDDPHSPRNVGIWGVLAAQLRSYERELFGLLARHPSSTARVADLEFGVSWCNQRGLWWLPHALHATIAAGFGVAAGWLVGAAWFAGLMSHPIEGWMVNAFGHAMGRRNFDTPDDSRNNYLVALLVFGEGLQNNHHHRPSSARFAYRAHEPDLGFVMCRVLARLGLLEIDEANLLPKRARN